MFLGNEYEKKVAGYRELIGHLEKLSPRTAEGKLPKAFLKMIEYIEGHIYKYERNKK